MKVAIMYSGGKDSTNAIEYCLSRKWNIKYLISVKPNRTDCYLFHFATVEHTKELAKILGIKQFYLTCSVANPEKEAEIVKKVIEKNKVDALVLGGIGLQETQLRTLQKTMMPLNVEVFAAQAGDDHEEIIKDMIKRGYEIMITQYACEGLNEEWLGNTLTLENFEELKKLAYKYGFHVGAEGGHWDSIVTGGPIFKDKRLKIISSKKIKETDYSGHLLIEKSKIVTSKLYTRTH